jgi:hypothetical protein
MLLYLLHLSDTQTHITKLTQVELFLDNNKHNNKQVQLHIQSRGSVIFFPRIFFAFMR